MKRVGLVSVVMLVLLVFSFSDSSAQLGFKGIGAHLGYADGGLSPGAIMFGGHANLGEIIPGLSLMPVVDYWSKDGISQFSINGDVAYALPVSESVKVMAIGGLSYVKFSSDDVVVPGFGTIGGVSVSGIGLNLGGIVSVPVSDNMSVGGALVYETKGEQLKIIGGFTFWLGGGE